ncbi:Flagellar basal-body rod protein FlgC [Candidatus Syntrophocurvum alkaliphilum]|uniref:Flagellar basal-body rod protein FlgC n=1 Tax=Candidatus Syntrophocurvum alkaliphilum TaxID=2293317 RepID=A0A6I6DFH4_9FIRM|nr:flagellar basal body rod protein FlgC [Candidatus Syntrophocurvum alkaliphilum]QGT99161.1 Flagellar basal-body rod protein FlgC [Candidatus Syntrophocurvum alkaliphilum]
MRFLNSIDVSASGLTAQRLRMDTTANNMANVETTRVNNGEGPYRRKVVVLEARENNKPQFNNVLKNQMSNNSGQGVRVSGIREVDDNESPFRRVHDPSHPDADEDGYVNYPNVNIVEEMINMISSTRAYEGNAKVIEASKNMAMRALDIGR